MAEQSNKNSLLTLYDREEEITPEEQNTSVGGANKPLHANNSRYPARQEQKEDIGILGTIADVAKGILTGIPKEAENLVQTGIDVADYVDKKIFDDKYIPNDVELDVVYDPKTSAGKTFQALTAFATGYLTSTRMITAPLKGAKVIQGMKPVFQKGVQKLIAGGVADFVTGDTSDKRIADIMIENEVFGHGLMEFMKSEEDDTAVEARFKNVLEGVVIGSAVDGLASVFKGIRHSYKAGKQGADAVSSAVAREQATEELTEKAIKENADESLIIINHVDTDNAIKASKEPAEEGTAKILAEIEIPDKVNTASELPLTKTNTGQGNIPLEGLTSTTEAQQQASRKASAEGILKMSGEEYIGARGTTDNPSMFNYGKFSDPTQDAITAFNKPIREVVGIEKMSMNSLADDTVKAMSDITGDIFGRMDDLRNASSVAEGLHKEVAYHTALIQYEIAPRLNKALQLVDDGAENAMEGLTNLVGRSLEELVELKKLYRSVGRAVKAADITSFIKAEDADTAIAKALADPLTYAHETIQAMSEEEIVALARRVKTANAIGSNVVSVMLESLPDGNAFKKVGQRKGTMLDSFKKYWYSMMLSSPKTQIRNLGGNSVKLVSIPLERTVYGMAKGATEGYLNNGLAGAGIGAIQGMKNGYYFLQGMKYNLNTAWKMSRIAFQNGTSILRGGNAKYAENLQPNSIFGYLSGYDVLGKTAGKVSNIATTPLKLLSGADEFFAQLVYGAEVHEKLMTSLNKSGVLKTMTDRKAQNEFIENFLKDNYDKAYREVLLANEAVVKGGAVYKEALELADDVTFQKELGDWGKGFTQFVAKCPPMQFIFPFQKTPINLFKDAFWTRSPYGAVIDLGRAINSKDADKAFQAVGHLATATLLWTTFYNLVSDGNITGAGPKDPIKRTALMQAGWTPYSLKTDNGYLSLSSFEPFGSGAMVLADIAEIFQRSESTGEDDMLELGEAGLNAVLRFSLNRTYLQGLADLVGSANRDNASSGWLTGFIQSLIPNAFKDTAQALDPTIYETKTLIEKVQSRLGMTDSLAPKTSWLTGLPLIYQHGGGLGAFNPFIKTEDTSDIVTTEMSRMKGISNPQKKINGVDLTAQEYSDYCRYHGTVKIDGYTLYEALEKTINSREYDVLRLKTEDVNDLELDESRNNLLVDTINRYRKRAKAQFLRDNPDFVRKTWQNKAGYQEGTATSLSPIISF